MAEQKQEICDRKSLILAIDDDRDNLLFISYILKLLEYRCVTTRSSKKFLLLVEQLIPDLILLDIVLPEINGLELIYQIKQSPNTCHIPVVVITGLTQINEKKQIEQAGCDAYLIKPFLIEDLEIILASYLPKV